MLTGGRIRVPELDRSSASVGVSAASSDRSYLIEVLARSEAFVWELAAYGSRQAVVEA